ncbi:unnamed protein product [Heterobilharzia americana]|nr:unnamed protein product [Heterobilharzia americana]
MAIFGLVFNRVLITLSRSFSNDTLRRTPLYDFHTSRNAKMVSFCNYSMPLQYSDQSIMDSHQFVRQHCGLFDVSHMLQIQIFGSDRIKFTESLTSADIEGLSSSSGTLSVFLNDDGRIMDDTIITKCREPYLYIVSNATCALKIQTHVTKKMTEAKKIGKELDLKIVDHALLALQGPDANLVLRSGISSSDIQGFENLYFMESMLIGSLFGLNASDKEIRLTRCGYTGEDGYEISIPAEIAIPVAEVLVNHSSVRPIGLAARDTLRLEAGMCLYGNDISEETTPVEASLSWLFPKQRRLGRDPKFPGYSIISNQLKNKSEVKHQRIGMISESGPPARHGAKIFDESLNLEVGSVTSGCLSPTLNKNIAMAYVKTDYCKPDKKLFIQIRQKFYPYTITKMPFVPNKYVRRP